MNIDAAIAADFGAVLRVRQMHSLIERGVLRFEPIVAFGGEVVRSH